MSAGIELKKWIDRTVGIPVVLGVRLIDGLIGRPPAEPPRAIERVLLVKFWGVGNLTMILPLARAVKRAHPRARIEFLSLATNDDILAASDVIDEVHRFDHRGLLRPWTSLIAIVRMLRRRRFDVVLDFEQFLRSSAIVTRLVRPRFSVGFRTERQARHGLYDRHVRHDESRHMARGFADLARVIGARPEELAPLEVPRCPTAAGRVGALLSTWRADERPIVVLHVGSGDNFPGRRWPPRAFARLADLLIDRERAVVVFTGTRAERDLVRECRGRMLGPSIDVTGLLGLRELIELLARVDLVVTNDTAPVHLASALGTRVIALYGPNTPVAYGPLGAQGVALYQELGCSPCIRNSNAKTSFCRVPICLSSIDPAAVLTVAHRLLASGPPERSPVLAAVRSERG